MLKEQERRSLEGLLGKRQSLFDLAEMIAYELDAGFDKGTPDAVVFPDSVEDVARIVQWAAERNVPLIARGAGTGLSGGAVAEHGGIIVEFSRMNRVLDLDKTGRTAMVEPGVVNQRLDELAKEKGLYYPPDPASGRSSTIGGNVAENAGGPHCFKYGVTTNYVIGLEVVLADGRIVRLGGEARDYPEYDLLGLLIGSEGTLGIVTKCGMRLIGNPPGTSTLMAAFDSVEQAGTAVSAVIAAGLVPAAMEMMDQQITRIIEDYAHAGLPTAAGAVLIVDVDGYPASIGAQMDEVTSILKAHGGYGLRIAHSAEDRDRIWFARKSAAGAMTRLAPAYYLVDGSVPRSRLAEALTQVNQICEAEGLPVGHVFHAGDGNLHPAILIKDPSDRDLVERAHAAGLKVVELCVSMNGSITGEHGVGIEKRDYMPRMYGPAELRAMQDVKDVFDPKNILNPGKILPSLSAPLSAESTVQERVQNPGVGAGFPCRGGEDSPRRGDLAPTPRSERMPFRSDGEVAPVCAPTSTEEAAAAIRASAAAGQRIRIRGGGTKSRLLPEADVLLETTGLRGVLSYAPDDLYITVGAGTLLTEVQEYLAHDGMHVPLASPWPQSTIGGIVATNANAPFRMRYGSIRDLVMATTAVLGDGRVVRVGRPVVKNVAGYDLPKVLVGSYGTLGLITDVTLKLCPLPRARRTLLIPAHDFGQGLSLASQVATLSMVASAILLCRGCDIPGAPQSPYLLSYTVEGLPEDVEAELAQVRHLIQVAGAPHPGEIDSPAGTDIWSEFMRNASGESLLVRAGIAPRDLSGYLERQSAALGEASFVVDVAAGLLYAGRRPRNADDAKAWVDELRRPALAAGGYAVVSDAPADLLVPDRWGYRPSAFDLMLRLKARWDPFGIMNPAAFLDYGG